MVVLRCELGEEWGLADNEEYGAISVEEFRGGGTILRLFATPEDSQPFCEIWAGMP